MSKGFFSSGILVVFALLTVPALLSSAPAQTVYNFQIGSYGDIASRGNLGVGAEIRTHIFPLPSQDWSASFWVGDKLLNGSFIQFGYSLVTSGRYCLYGHAEGANGTCIGSYDTILANDPRWFWQYWPDANVTRFYFGNGPLNSAGPDEAWHLYQITPNSKNGWNFVFDGKIVTSVSYRWMHSMDEVSVVAEEGSYASSPSGTLGPVEFRNISYYSRDGWHEVTALHAYSGCVVVSGFTISECSAKIPYGVTDIGPNDVTAGSNQTGIYNSELIWTTNPIEVTVSDIMFGGAFIILTTFVGNSFRKRSRLKQQIKRATIAEGKHCPTCGSPLRSQVNFCPGCGNEIKPQKQMSA